MLDTMQSKALRRTWVFRGIEITLYPSGWYSAFVSGSGFLKADTLTGMREIIRLHLAGSSR